MVAGAIRTDEAVSLLTRALEDGESFGYRQLLEDWFEGQGLADEGYAHDLRDFSGQVWWNSERGGNAGSSDLTPKWRPAMEKVLEGCSRLVSDDQDLAGMARFAFAQYLRTSCWEAWELTWNHGPLLSLIDDAMDIWNHASLYSGSPWDAATDIAFRQLGFIGHELRVETAAAAGLLGVQADIAEVAATAAQSILDDVSSIDIEVIADALATELQRETAYYGALALACRAALDFLEGSGDRLDAAIGALGEVEDHEDTEPEDRSEMRAHRLALTALARGRGHDWLRVDAGSVICLFPFGLHGPVETSFVETVIRHGEHWSLAGLKVTDKPAEFLMIDDIWQGDDVLNRGYEGTQLLLPDLELFGPDGEQLATMEASIRFSRLGNHLLRIEIPLEDALPDTLFRLMWMAAPEYGDLREIGGGIRQAPEEGQEPPEVLAGSMPELARRLLEDLRKEMDVAWAADEREAAIRLEERESRAAAVRAATRRQETNDRLKIALEKVRQAKDVVFGAISRGWRAVVGARIWPRVRRAILWLRYREIPDEKGDTSSTAGQDPVSADEEMENPRLSTRPGMYHVITRLDQVSSVPSGDVSSDQIRSLDSPDGIEGLFGAEMLHHPIPPGIGSIAQWALYDIDESAPLQTPALHRDVALNHGNMTLMACFGSPSFMVHLMAETLEFAFSLEGMLSGWQDRLVIHYDLVWKRIEALEAQLGEEAGRSLWESGHASFHAEIDELEVRQLSLRKFVTSNEATMLFIASPGLVTSPVTRTTLDAYLEMAGVWKQYQAFLAFAEDVLGDRIEELIVSRLRQHEERQKERTRLIVEAAAFFIAAIGISGILSLVQEGWSIDGHGTTLLVVICVVVALCVTVLLYRFLRISNKRRSA